MSEVELILKDLNALRPETTASGSLDHRRFSPATNLRFLKERIHAVRYENRDLREKLERIHKENQRLRKELEQLHHEKQNLEDEVQLATERARQQEEDARASRRHLEEITLSWNWRIAHRFHSVWGRGRRWLKSLRSNPGNGR